MFRVESRRVRSGAGKYVVKRFGGEGGRAWIVVGVLLLIGLGDSLTRLKRMFWGAGGRGIGYGKEGSC